MIIEHFKNKTILITGANGLIGGALAEYFYKLNIKNNLNIKLILTSLSNFSKSKRIKHLIKPNEDTTYISHDMSTPWVYTSYTFDYVFYCSGYGQPRKFNEAFEATCFINTVGLNSILKHTKNSLTKCTVCYMSSSEIYGDAGYLIEETNMGKYSVENNRSIYITSKRLGESIMLRYKDSVNVKIMRVSLAYGPGMLWTDDRVMQDFIRKSKKGIINMHDDGSDIRCYNYIDNCIEMILNATIKGKEKIYNIANPSSQITIYELAKLIKEVFNPKCEIVKGGKKTSNSPNVVSMSIERYTQEFGIPKFTHIHDGLKEIKKYFKSKGLL